MQQVELMEKRKEVLQKQIDGELAKAQQLLKQGNRAGKLHNMD